MFRALRRRWLLWNADAIRAERDAYQQAGAVGPEYVKNSLMAELDCRRRAFELGVA